MANLPTRTLRNYLSTLPNGASGSVLGTDLTKTTVQPARPEGYATAAQGAKADTSVQPGDLGNSAALDIASQSQAEAGVLNDKAMTPLRTRQAIDTVLWRASKFGVSSSSTAAQNKAGLEAALAEAAAFLGADPYRALSITLDPGAIYEMDGGIMLPSNVIIEAEGGRQSAKIIHAGGDPILFDTEDGIYTAKRYSGIKGLEVEGDVNDTLNLIRFRGSLRPLVENCLLMGCAGSALSAESSTRNGRFSRIYAYNTVRGAVSGYTGAITIAGGDHKLFDVDAQVGETSIGSAYTNGYKVAFYITGGTTWLDQCRAELSEIGVVVEGGLDTIITGLRCDLNYGGGVLVASSEGIVIDGLNSQSNGQDAHDTYDVVTLDASSLCSVKGIVDRPLSSVHKMRYGVNQTGASPATARRHHIETPTGDFGTAPISASSVHGPSVSVEDNVPIGFTAGDTTPSVKGGKNFFTQNTVDTTITGFDDMYYGQTIEVQCRDAFTIIDHSASLVLPTRADMRLQPDFTYTFRKDETGIIRMMEPPPIRKYGTAVWDIPSLAVYGAAGDMAYTDVTVMGVAATDRVNADFAVPGNSGTGYDNRLIELWGSAIAANTVRLYARNLDPSNTNDPNATTVYVEWWPRPT